MKAIHLAFNMVTPALLNKEPQGARSGGIMQSRTMTPLLLVRALVFWLAVGGSPGGRVTAHQNLRRVSKANEDCPQCEAIFTMLETERSGERVQHIHMAERGQGYCLVV